MWNMFLYYIEPRNQEFHVGLNNHQYILYSHTCLWPHPHPLLLFPTPCIQNALGCLLLISYHSVVYVHNIYAGLYRLIYIVRHISATKNRIFFIWLFIYIQYFIQGGDELCVCAWEREREGERERRRKGEWDRVWQLVYKVTLTYFHFCIDRTKYCTIATI